ncbi:MAG: hypothetical protein EVA89_09300 [Sandaracinaceae bacterium]|nr:MAG: hypothetical protein EVA89_09300 [Sandaracinaceae bacterium]
MIGPGTLERTRVDLFAWLRGVAVGLSRRLTVVRCVVLFVVLALTNVVQSVVYFEVASPGRLSPVAIGGRGLGLLLSPFALGVAAALARRRFRASTDSASDAGRG